MSLACGALRLLHQAALDQKVPTKVEPLAISIYREIDQQADSPLAFDPPLLLLDHNGHFRKVGNGKFVVPDDNDLESAFAGSPGILFLHPDAQVRRSDRRPPVASPQPSRALRADIR